MSLDLFLTRYVDGVEVVLDPVAVRAVLEPLITDRDAQHEFVRIGAADAPADESDPGFDAEPADDSLEVFGYGEPLEQLMLDIAGESHRGLVLELARRTGAAIAPTDGPVAVTDEATLAHLPEELRGDAVVVGTVEEFTAFLVAED